MISFCFAAPSVFSQQKIEDFYFSNYGENGDKSWEVEGREAMVFDSRVEIDDMNATYYGKEKKVAVSAEKGTLTKPEMDTYLEKNVRVRSDDGATLFTESLNWARASNEIATEDEVVLRNGEFTVEAEGLKSRNTLKQVDFEKKVKVNLAGNEERRTITIECDGPLEVDFQTGNAVFYNKVSVDSEQGRMFSDKTTVFFDKDKKTVIKIVAEGDVKMIRDENVTFAEKAVYIEQEQKLFLEGSPRLILFPENENIRN